MTNLIPKYYFLDLEVDSVPKNLHDPSPSIKQIAILDPSREKGKRIFNAYITPHVELMQKPEEINFDENNNEPRRYFFKQAWPNAVKWVNQGLDGNRKAIIIMHNGFKHDWPILQTEVARVLSETNLAIPKFWKPFDTLYLKTTLQIPGDSSLSGICHTLRVNLREAHNAINDVKMTKGIFKRMIGNAPLDKVLLAALKERPIVETANLIKSFAGTDIIVFDFEATSLFPKEGEKGLNPRAVQLAGYIPSCNKIFNELINPNMSIPRESSAFHGIYDADVQGRHSFKAVWMQFEEFIHSNIGNTANAIHILVGHNIWGYDLRLYRTECERVGLPKKDWKTFDTLFLARNQFKGIKEIPKAGFFKQEYLCPLLGINIEKAHDAQDDVLASFGLFKAMTEGVDATEVSKAMLSDHPVLCLGQLCHDKGTFDGKFYFELYKKACGLTIDFAKQIFDSIENEQFFGPKNLGSLLDVNIASTDSEIYILWRIFLTLTKGMDRKTVNKAIQSENPLKELKQLYETSGSFKSIETLKSNKKACESTFDLARALFSFIENEQFFEPEKFAKLVGVELANKKPNLFEMKRIFLHLTAGVPKKELEKALFSEFFIKEIADLILQKGSFNPESFFKKPAVAISAKPKSNELNDFFAETSMEEEVKVNPLKRRGTELIDIVTSDDESLPETKKRKI